MTGARKMTNVVEGEIVYRSVAFPAHAAGMRGDRHLVVDASLPERVVIVGALDRETVDIETAGRIVAAGIMASAATFERASDMVRDHDRFHRPRGLALRGLPPVCA